MSVWYYVCIFLVLGSIPFTYLCIKYRNPYKLIMVFGKKGAGKTTYLTKLALTYRRSGWPVYSTEYIPGTYHIEPEQIGYVHLPERSVLLVDEVGMIYDNRDYKNFKKEVRDWFKLQRHRKVIVYLFSQTFDIDLKLRNLTDKMYMLVNYFGWWTVGKEIRRKLVVVKPGEQSESRIADELIITPLLLTPFGARIFIFVPYWARFFDSHAAPELKKSYFPVIQFPDHVNQRLVKKWSPRERWPRVKKPWNTGRAKLGGYAAKVLDMPRKKKN